MWFVNILLAATLFDSTAWLERRAVKTQDAGRLRNVYLWCTNNLSTPAEQVRLPVDMHPDGSIKTLVLADKAQMFVKQGYIWGREVTIGENDVKGKPVAAVTAAECAVDRNARTGWLEGEVGATYNDMLLTGVNAYVSAQEEYVAIFSNAVMRTKVDAIRKNGDTNGIVRLAANRADFDRHAGIVHLEGAVRLDEPEYQLAADRAFAFLEGTNIVRRIEVVGSVAVTNGQRTANCEKATYDCRTGQLMMYKSVFEFDLSDKNFKKGLGKGRKGAGK